MEVEPFALVANDHEELDRAVERAEPVWRPGGELGGLARLDRELLVAEQQPQVAGEDVEPVVALVYGQLVGRGAPRCWGGAIPVNLYRLSSVRLFGDEGTPILKASFPRGVSERN